MKSVSFKNKNKLASLLLRIGLASVLVYASISAFITPSDWIGYLPHILTSRYPSHILIGFFSVYEMSLAVWLVSGYYIKYAAILAALTFSGIILTNLRLLPLTFRDLTMVFAALALIFIEV